MTQILIDLSNKHFQIVLKHGEESGLQFEDALIDLIEVHADNKENAVRETMRAVKDTGSVGGGKSVTVKESSVTIQDVYALAEKWPVDVPFTIFDVMETMDSEKLLEVTEDQTRGWGTPFSNWINKNSDKFKVVEGNPQPRQYVRF